MSEGSVASFDGTRIWFSDSGGDGPTVVLLHGATMTSLSNFETRFGVGGDGRAGPVKGPAVASRLRGAGARVVGVDAPGPGREWADHPEYKPYRAFARLYPVHDFESLGAALIGLDGVPAARLHAATVPVLVLNGGGDDPEDSAATLAAMIPGATARVVGSADHGFACSDDDFQAALVSFLSHGWPRSQRTE